VQRQELLSNELKNPLKNDLVNDESLADLSQRLPDFKEDFGGLL
jgi:hypothetical protein